MKSVLLVGNFLSSAGASRGVCEELASRLPAAGWHVSSTSTKRPRLLRLADMLLVTSRLHNRYRVAQVDVYSGSSFIWAECVCFLLRLLGKPVVLTLRGGNLPSFGQRWPRRMQRLLNSASAVTTPSRYLQEALRAYRGDLRLLPNPIDVGNYPFRPRSDPEPTLVWLRALHKVYNPCMAVRATACLRDHPSPPLSDASQIRLAMFGPNRRDGSDKDLGAEIRRLKLENVVSVSGGVPKSEVPTALSTGDIFLNTPNVDNTPVSVIEALACGLCVISTNVGGIPYLLEHEKDALLVPPDDARAMAGAIRRILTEPELAERLSRNGRAKAEQFDWSVILPQWEDLLTGVTAESLGWKFDSETN